MSDQMPDGWAAAPLDVLGHLHCGQSPPTTAVNHCGDGAPYVSGPDQWRFGRLVLDKWTTEPKRLVPDGCIFITVKGAGVGTTFPGVRCSIGRDIYAFQPHPRLSKGYIHLALDQDIQTIIGRAAGLIPGLTREHILAQVVPVPPLDEQDRIVAKVEALLARVNAARGRLADVPVIMKRFRWAILAAACSGRLTHGEELTDYGLPPGWEVVPVGDLLPEGGLFDGPFGSSLKTSDYTQEGVRVVRLENLGHLQFKPEKRAFISQEKYNVLKKHTVREGDIIFGSFIDETVRVCVLPPLDAVAIAKADCFCLRPRPGLADPHYLAYQLACDRTRASLLEEVHGATRPRITTKQLRAVRIPLCGIEEQREIVRHVEALLALADSIERRVAAGRGRADSLTQSILAKALRGELVPTEAELASQEGREYESAAALLERIREEREKERANPTVDGRRVRGARAPDGAADPRPRRRRSAGS